MRWQDQRQSTNIESPGNLSPSAGQDLSPEQADDLTASSPVGGQNIYQQAAADKAAADTAAATAAKRAKWLSRTRMPPDNPNNPGNPLNAPPPPQSSMPSANTTQAAPPMQPMGYANGGVVTTNHINKSYKNLGPIGG